ncbi:aldo/keto reductase [Candidatus Latescibacterota bacterium]
MKRRDFIIKGSAGSAALGMSGCSMFSSRRIDIKSQRDALNLEVTKSKPSGGTLPTGELGETGIKVSNFGFGSHMPRELVKYKKERGVMLREAYDLGITTFDVYERNMGGVMQWEPTGEHLAPVINDVVISILMMPSNGVDLKPELVEPHLERALRMFKRDYIDMVRPPVHTTKPLTHDYMSELFRLKEKGKIRAVGFPIHESFDIDPILDAYPIDFMLFPYNFYHNCLTNGLTTGTTKKYDAISEKLRNKGIGVAIMKPLGSDWFVRPLIEAAKQLDDTNDISLPQAALRYIINSDVNADVVFSGMYRLDNVYENVDAFYNPAMSSEEKQLLKKLRRVAKVSASNWLPDYYKFLDKWSPDIFGNDFIETA